MILKIKPQYLLVLLSLPLISLISCSVTEEVTTDSTCNASSYNCASPVSVTGISSATAISGGRDHMCSLISGGTAKCWGDNYYGALGDGTTTIRITPVSVSGLSGVSELAAGSDFTCARLSEGTAKCWSLASYGRPGNNNDSTNQLPHVSVSGLTGASQISSRSQSTCAVISGNAVKCWGRNDKGQLGSTDTYDRLTPIQAGE